jgi:hypothetical protein
MIKLEGGNVISPIFENSEESMVSRSPTSSEDILHRRSMFQDPNYKGIPIS